MAIYDTRFLKNINDTLANGTLDVNIQDQTTEVVDVYLFNGVGTFEIAVDAIRDSYDVEVVSNAGMLVGHVLCFQEGSSFMQALILDINGTTISMDSPFDFAFTTSGGCSFGSRDLAVDGSVTPMIFRVGPGNLAPGQGWDIVRVMFTMVDEVEMDDGTFGGIPALPKGMILRHVNGHNKNIFNAKTNGELALRNYDGQYADAPKKGFYGYRSRRTFGGQSKNGVVIRLFSAGDDQIQVIVQDDLTDLESFYCVAQGHMIDE